MSRSTRLRLSDVRRVYQLLGECRDVGYDPVAWRRHAMEGLRQLIGAQVVAGGVARLRRDGPFEFPVIIDFGWEGDAEREYFGRFMAQGGAGSDRFRDGAVGARMAVSRLTTNTREEFMDDASWYSSEAFNDYWRHSRIDRDVLTVAPIVDGEAMIVSVMNFFRALGEPGFDRRSVAIVHLFHEEALPLIGKQLAAVDRALPELPFRLRQTLRCLLEGESEKQIAKRLNLSRDTVHKHVGALYRRFGVQSRGELQALWIRRRFPLEAIGSWEELFGDETGK